MGPRLVDLGAVGAGLVGGDALAIVAAAPGHQWWDLPLGVAGVAAVATGTGLGVAQFVRNDGLRVAPTARGGVISGWF